MPLNFFHSQRHLYLFGSTILVRCGVQKEKKKDIQRIYHLPIANDNNKVFLKTPMNTFPGWPRFVHTWSGWESRHMASGYVIRCSLLNFVPYSWSRKCSVQNLGNCTFGYNCMYKSTCTWSIYCHVQGRNEKELQKDEINVIFVNNGKYIPILS